MAKITYEDKVGVEPKEVHINEVWDDDMNEIKRVVNGLDDDKQNNLESGTNIKTLNNQSLLGSGNLSIRPYTASASDDELNILDGATITTDELNILDGVTASTDEINLLDGLTASTSELNILDGVTATTEEINILDGVTASTSELNILDGVTADKDEINKLDGLTASTDELNLLDGVTATTDELNILDGVTATKDEINILDGVTASTDELNLLDGVTASTDEINYLDGVTSDIQGQLDDKLGKEIVFENVTANYTISNSDFGKTLYINSSNAITITIPEDTGSFTPTAKANFVQLIQEGTGEVTIAGETNVNPRNPRDHTKLFGQYAPAELRYLGSNNWLFFGVTKE